MKSWDGLVYASSPNLCAQYRFVTAIRVGADLHVSWEEAVRESIALQLRAPEVRKVVRTWTKKHASSRFIEKKMAVVREGRGTDRAIEQLDVKFVAISTRPFTGRLVERALNISTQERLLWTKDGRLPVSGRNEIHRGHTIALATYGVDDIERIARNRSIIEVWRLADLSQGPV